MRRWTALLVLGATASWTAIIDTRDSAAAVLLASGVHTVYSYDLNARNSIWVDGSGYTYPGGVAYDAEQDDAYYIVYGSGSYNKYLVRDTEALLPSQGVETVASWSDNTISWNNLDVGPQSQVALAYSHRFGASNYWPRPTRVVLHDAATNAQVILHEVEKYGIVGWQGYYDPRPIWKTIHGIRDVSFDHTGQYIYFTDGPEGTISRVPVDVSTGREVILSGLDDPNSLDISGNSIYWTELGTGTIRTSGLLGESVTDLLVPGETPGGLAVGGGEIFWTQGSQEWARVWHANLDGSNPLLLDDNLNGESIAFGGPTSPVPEPTTFIVWSGLITLGISVGWRRSRKRLAA